MRLYRKIIPKIAQEIVGTLHKTKLIDVDADKKVEAELDLAAVMVEYMNTLEVIDHEARDLAKRRGIGPDRMHQIRNAVAESKKVKIGEEGTEYVLEQVLEGLMASKNIEEVYADDKELRKLISEIFNKFASVDEVIDKEARRRIKNHREGTPEWDIEYGRLVAQLKRQKGLI